MDSFQNQNRANQGSIFLHLHLWMHTILASRYLTDHNYGRRDRKIGTNGHHHGNGNGTGNGNGNGIASGQATPQTMTVNNMWRNSARTIGDILVLSDIINPFTYVALPFVNQAFYVAGSCYVKGESSLLPHLQFLPLPRSTFHGHWPFHLLVRRANPRNRATRRFLRHTPLRTQCQTSRTLPSPLGVSSEKQHLDPPTRSSQTKHLLVRRRMDIRSPRTEDRGNQGC